MYCADCSIALLHKWQTEHPLLENAPHIWCTQLRCPFADVDPTVTGIYLQTQLITAMMRMLRTLSFLVTFLLFTGAASAQEPPIAIAIHGGAGTILPENMTERMEAEYRSVLEEALRAGYVILEADGSSLDAVVAAVQVLEESPHFNAGRGAVLTNDETIELDASIMEGRRRDAGAVASVKHVRSPIALARLVMEESPHVMLVGQGAEAFARDQGLEPVPNEYFRTQRRLEQVRRLKAREDATGSVSQPEHPDDADPKHGTVGAVALDRDGNLAAATSTGGMSNKKFGRVGDSPIIGAGTYADNSTCAVSATGHGEFFIRGVVAYDIAAMMRYAGLGVSDAADAVIHGKLTDMQGTGGVIAMDALGNVAMPFNTPGMYRGKIGTDGAVDIRLFAD